MWFPSDHFHLFINNNTFIQSHMENTVKLQNNGNEKPDLATLLRSLSEYVVPRDEDDARYVFSFEPTDDLKIRVWY